MTDKFEDLKRDVGDRLSRLIPNSYSENTMLNTIEYLASQGRIVPDGWVAVPLKPTEKMIYAGNDKGEWGCYESSLYWRCSDEGNSDEIYKAMIAARPEVK